MICPHSKDAAYAFLNDQEYTDLPWIAGRALLTILAGIKRLFAQVHS